MVEVPDTYLKGRKPEDFCAMHVRGDSMYPDFRDGDIVLVLKQNTMNHSGEIGVIAMAMTKSPSNASTTFRARIGWSLCP